MADFLDDLINKNIIDNVIAFQDIIENKNNKTAEVKIVFTKNLCAGANKEQDRLFTFDNPKELKKITSLLWKVAKDYSRTHKAKVLFLHRASLRKFLDSLQVATSVVNKKLADDVSDVVVILFNQKYNKKKVKIYINTDDFEPTCKLLNDWAQTLK